MTFKKKRAFHLGGASWLLLCAIGNPARWPQDAAAPSAATQLPEITVTAPSPIVRREPCRRARPRASPARRPAAIASAPPEPQAGARRRRAATGRAARRHRPVRHRHRGAERGNPPLRRRDARRSPVLQARHHRLQLCAGRLEPADHPRASTSTASASSRTASAAAAPPISARIISCRSIRSPPTRSR